MKNTTSLWMASGLGLLAGLVWLSFATGVRQGMKTAGITEHSPVPAAGVSVTVMANPEQWTVAEGEAATRRHLATGIRAGDIDPETGLAVLHYYDPMRPASKFDAPGKSPFMDMMLVPAYGGGGSADAGTIVISSRMEQNTGIRTATVVTGTLVPTVSATGEIAWNEQERYVLQARANGFVTRVHVPVTLDRVMQAAPLVELYVPDWVAVQEDYLALARMQGRDLEPLLVAARSRMRQAGMEEAQIRLVMETGELQATITLAAPVTGVVSEVAVREGMTVTPGMTLFRLNGTNQVWADAQVPETQLARLQAGDLVKVTTPSLPGMLLEGRIQSLLPVLDTRLRTRTARVVLPNPDGNLVPGMQVQMQIMAAASARLTLVPTEAVIDTGTRKVVMLAEADGRFRPVTVTSGIETGGQTEITAGLQAGQEVVVSGQFLLDSEASLRGLEARLEPATELNNSTPVHHTTARIEALEGNRVMLTHPPISSLDWPGMTMGFLLPAAEVVPDGLAAGDQVEIDFIVEADSEAQITRIRATGQGDTP